VSNILDFPKNFASCKVIRLERNYRSTPAILKLANDVIHKNVDRHGKVLRANPQAEPGLKPECFVYDTDDIEAEEVIRHIQYFKDQGYKQNEIAILYRSNGQGGLLESQLRQNRIEYVITGGTGFFDRKETRDILAYLRCSILPNEVAFRRIINTPHRGIGDASIEKLTEFANQNNISFVAAARRWQEAEIAPKVGESLQQLFSLLADLPADIFNEAASPSSNLLRRFQEIGYRDYIRAQCKDLDSFNKRWGVLESFGRVLESFIERGQKDRATLQEFIDAMELRHSDDEEKDKEAAALKVQLLTLHASKGLEFPVVILIGVEEDLLPHKTLGSDISEERRLFYVGVTRAKERLVLSRARTRKRYGRYVPVSPSRFLVEVPEGSIVTHDSGYRPVVDGERESMLAKLRESLGGKIASQKIDLGSRR
jgi:DNA helicase-2/ATP-dependent DNA helicase PcrA